MECHIGVISGDGIGPEIVAEAKGGLSERRIAIIKEYNFYNQQYCGCEFSMRKEEKGVEMRLKQM